MAKRFTDTDKWKKPFIRNLPTRYKVLWFYIIDECDHAGIWQVDMPVAEIKTGEKFNETEAWHYFGDKIIVFDNSEKWFIPSFIEFQYGELKKENRAHNSVLNILSKYNLLNKIKPLTSPLQGAMDKDTEMDTGKELRSVDKFKESFDNDYKTDEKVFKENGFSPEQLAKAKLEFWNSKELDTEMLGKSFQDVQKHFLNWCRQNKERIKKKEEVKTEYKPRYHTTNL